MNDHRQNANSQNDHWLARPDTVKKLWWVFSVLLALTVAAQLFIYVKGYFGVDGWFGFAAAFGFLSCLAMVLFAKFVGLFLKRSEDYYGERDDDV